MSGDIEKLFKELVDLTEPERSRRLEALSLPEWQKQELRELIAHDRTASAGLGKAVGSVAEAALGQDQRIGMFAGAYRLTRLLGRGGMGAVYLGERDDDTIEHFAAIKLIYFGVPELQERFLRERQILASLSHPNIVQWLDAGNLSDGVPYFTMEYCESEAIDKYCRRQGLDVRRILDLFLPVCAAVHYAHQRMIVHRDLKPSNIIVTSAGVPKLVDFGIAKILDDPAIEPTQPGARLMTFHFASPEQIRGELVGAASDVYSLGAVLYLLLTGHYPRESASGTISPAMLEAELVRPRIWQPLLPGDVENILITALRPEPSRRYSSAEALADDIRRFLDHRPVLATPPSYTYQANRFFRRNPVASLATLLAIVSLLGGTGFSLYQARQAQKNLADVRQMANVMLFDFERSIRHLPGTQEARHHVVDTARAYLEKIAPQAGNDPELQREVADAYLSLADVEYTSTLSRQGAEAAVRSLQASLNIRRALGDRSTADGRRLLPYIETAARLCGRSVFVGKMAVARESCTEAAQLADEWITRAPQDRSAMIAAQEAFLQNGLMMEADGRAASARQSMEQSYTFATILMAGDPSGSEFRLKLSRAGRHYAELLLTLKEPLRAIAPAEKGVQASQELLGLDPRNIPWRIEAATALMGAGSAHQSASAKEQAEFHLAQAAKLLVQALDLNRETGRLDPMSSSAQDSLIVTHHRLARVRERQRRYSDALDLYHDARKLIQQRVDREATRRNLYLMGNNYLNAAGVDLLAGNRREAASAYEQSVHWLRRTLAIEPNDAVTRENLVTVRFSQARMAEEDRDLDVARRQWALAWEEAQKMIQHDASAKSYLSDFEGLQAMGRRLGRLSADQ